MTEFGGARPCEFSEYLLKTQWKETRLVIMKGIPLKWSARQGDFHSGWTMENQRDQGWSHKRPGTKASPVLVHIEVENPWQDL